MATKIQNIVLAGFSGTGKSCVGQLVARQLSWGLVDTDQEIVRASGKSIANLFVEDGEEAFREIERRVVQEACSRSSTVIVMGGGAIMDPDNQKAMFLSSIVVCLEASPETIYARLHEQTPTDCGTEARPLLGGPQPLMTIRALKAERQAVYALAHWIVSTDHLSVAEVAHEVVRGVALTGLRPGSYATAEAVKQSHGAISVVTTAGESCPVFIGWGILRELGQRLLNTGLTGTVFVVTDESVANLYGLQVQRFLEADGFVTHLYVIPSGEPSKSLAMAYKLYGWLASHRAERRDVVAAVGGGVVGDLAGYVAATFGRGMPLVQIPTSLAAMVDASIGGKVAVNLPEGKNLVGSFHQPRLIMADVQALLTLPKRELMSGWAEVIKHGLILDDTLFTFIEDQADELLELDPDTTTRAIWWSAEIKTRVVSKDEREIFGLRTLLNYGHTIGHALEAATEYGRFLHGEAVAIGMRAAGMIGQELGVTQDGDVLKRQQALLDRFGLPSECPMVDLMAVQEAMALDKKTVGGHINWVLLERVGKAVVRNDVPPHIPIQVIRDLAR